MTISGLVPNTDYWIDVRAENSGGESGYSGDLMARTAALMPPGVPPIRRWWPQGRPRCGCGQLQAVGELQTSTGGGSRPTQTITDADRIETSINPEITFTGLVDETDYWIDVRAENADGNSAYSGDLMETTDALPPPAVTTKYFLLTADATVPTATEFLASPTTFEGEVVNVPAHLQVRYYHCAHPRNDIANIHEQNIPENFRDQWTAMANLPTRTINGTTYYVYTTIFAQYPIGTLHPACV